MMIPNVTITILSVMLVVMSISSISTVDAVNATLSYDPLESAWLHLNYDSDNFICENFEGICTAFLDAIDCTSREIKGCAGTGEYGQIDQYVGTCKCYAPTYQNRGGRVSRALLDNRVRSDVPWMLEPWATGPPYDFDVSYTAICQLALHRIGCPADKENIVMGSLDGSVSYTCACGTYTDSSPRIAEVIVDQLYASKLSALPVFEQPFTFNAQFSLSFVFIFGKIGSMIAQIFYLPPVIGFLLTGMGMQDIISRTLIKGALGGAPFSEFRNFALVVIIMRAALSLNPEEVWKRGYMTVALSCLPYFVEFAVILAMTMYLYDWDSIDAGLFASIMAALSPSLIIPFMIQLVDKGYGFTAKSILIAAPMEIVLSFIMFNIFSNLEVTEPSTMYPWMTVQPLYANILLIPVNIIYSGVIGYVAGYVITKYFHFRRNLTVIAVAKKEKAIEKEKRLKELEEEKESEKESNEKVDKVLAIENGHNTIAEEENEKESMIDTARNIYTRISVDSTAEFCFVSIVTCYTLYSICQPYYLQYSSGILAIFTCMLTVAHYGQPAIVNAIKDGLVALWVFLEVILFTTTGINLSFKGATGPLQSNRGISGTYVEDTIYIIAAGIAARFGGILLAGFGGWFTLSEHRRNIKYLLVWTAATWLFEFPKAAVQATLGGLPLSQGIIPGTDGLKKGIYIQQATAFSVLIMAPLGALLMGVVGEPLARWLRDYDQAHGEFAHKSVDGVSIKAVEAEAYKKAEVEASDANDTKELPNSDNSDDIVVKVDSIVPLGGNDNGRYAAVPAGDVDEV